MGYNDLLHVKVIPTTTSSIQDSDIFNTGQIIGWNLGYNFCLYLHHDPCLEYYIIICSTVNNTDTNNVNDNQSSLENKPLSWKRRRDHLINLSCCDWDRGASFTKLRLHQFFVCFIPVVCINSHGIYLLGNMLSSNGSIISFCYH